MADCIIIGSGIAGHSAAVELARRAPHLSVCMLAREAGPPYDRPPLSKTFLATPDAGATVLPQGVLATANFERRDGVEATAIDLKARTVSASDGSEIPFGKLLIATGSTCKQLPLRHVDPNLVYYLRTLKHAERLRPALHKARRVAIVGGGFIGLEVAAVARELGCSVVLIEKLHTILARSCSALAAGRISAMHRSRGVRLLLGQANVGVRQKGSHLIVECDADAVEADILVVGIGVEPNLDLAVAAGLRIDDGIAVNDHFVTSDAAVYAAGDVARYPIPRLSFSARSESWSVSSAQGTVAARNMAGDVAVLNELPWFWSDQYDITFQRIGFPERPSRVYGIEDRDAGKWLRFGIDDDGYLLGAEGIRAVREMAALRRADRSRQRVPANLLEECREEQEVEAVEV